MHAGILSPTARRSETEQAAGVEVARALRGLSDRVARCLDRFFRWGAAPTVDAYCDLFGSDGTLLDADMAAPIRGAAIRDAITGVLSLLPDFRFAPVRVIAEEPHVFVRAANRATLGDRALAWDAVYALTLDGDRIAAGRRYYDRGVLVTGLACFAAAAGEHDAAGERDVPVSVASTSPVSAAAHHLPLLFDLAARADAWNGRDVAALVGPIAHARLRMAGVGRDLDGSAAARAVVEAFLARAPGLRLAPGAVARTPSATAVEWVGSIGAGADARRFALVELVDALPAIREWHLLFDTSAL